MSVWLLTLFTPSESHGCVKMVNNSSGRIEKIPELREKNRFLSFSSTFKDQIDTDILVRSGDKGSAIPAHKAVLVNIYIFFPL